MIDANRRKRVCPAAACCVFAGICAHVRVITAMTNLDDPGPLAVPASL